MSRELYSFRGPYWSLPVWVTTEETQPDVARLNVGAGVHLLEIQHAAARERLTAIGGWKANGRWWVNRKELEQFFVPAVDQTENPEMLVEWRPWHRTVAYRKDARARTAETTRAADEFFHEFCKLGWVASPAQAEALWTAYCQHAMHWLLNEQRPVDFGFFQLHALPLRVNWKEIARYNYVRNKHRLQAKNPQVNEQRLRLLLEDSRLTAYDRSAKRFQWNLEAVASGSWRQFSEEFENQRMRRTRHYTLHYIEHLWALYRGRMREMRELYGHYITGLRQPYVQLADQHHPRNALSPEGERKRGDLGILRPTPRLPFAYDHATRRPVKPVVVGTGDVAVGAMPDVRAVGLATGDVRDTGPAVD